MKRVVLLALPLLMLLPACATITRGSNTAMKIETSPSGARVSTSNGFICESTPCTFQMSRKSEFRVTITKEGFKPFEGTVTHRLAGAGGAGFAGNVLVGGLIGMTVDANSGAMNDLYPNPLSVTLAPVRSDQESIVTPAATTATPARATADKQST